MGSKHRIRDIMKDCWQQQLLTTCESEPDLREGNIRWNSSFVATEPTPSRLSSGHEHANIAYMSHWSSLMSVS